MEECRKKVDGEMLRQPVAIEEEFEHFRVCSSSFLTFP